MKLGLAAAVSLLLAAPSAGHPTVTFVRFAPAEGHPSLYTVDPAHALPRRLPISLAAVAAPAWSRDGRRVVFSGGANPAGRADIVGPSHLWTARPDGSHTLALTKGPVRDGAASWSPDGARIVFVRAAAGANRSSLWIVDRSGRHARRLTQGGIDLEPSWAPDGGVIAFVRIDPSTFQSGIWLIRPDGTRGHRILSAWRGLTDPVWSPDGRRLLVEDGRTLLSVRPDGRDRRVLARLTRDVRGAVEDPAPSWSPDGTLVAFCQLRRGSDGASDIWIVRADGAGLRRLTHSPGLDTDPTWRP